MELIVCLFETSTAICAEMLGVPLKWEHILRRTFINIPCWTNPYNQRLVEHVFQIIMALQIYMNFKCFATELLKVAFQMTSIKMSSFFSFLAKIKAVGCDLIVGSEQKVDSCGICGGQNECSDSRGSGNGRFLIS